MNAAGRGWRRFRRLPVGVQGGVAAAIVAFYTVVLVLLVGGGGDGADGGGQAAAARPEPVAQSALDRRVLDALQDAKGAKLPKEQNDVPAFRRAVVRRVRCEDRTCNIVYAVGLPGQGRILQDQRHMWERLFSETDVVKATMTVTRDTAAAGVPPNPKGEETPSGAPLLATMCDRSKHPDVKWASATGAQILQSICKVQGYDQGEIHSQEPVAPDDPAAEQPELPE